MTVAGVCTYYPTYQFKSQTDASRHIEGRSTAASTALNYATLRLLGVPVEHPVIVRALATLHKLGGHNNSETYYVRLRFSGGAAASAFLGKFWLSILNVYDWEGNNPIPPEIWCVRVWNIQISSFDWTHFWKAATSVASFPPVTMVDIPPFDIPSYELPIWCEVQGCGRSVDPRAS